MGDDDDGLALLLQLRQQFGVEHAPERRVLISGPLVEDQHLTLVQPRVDQCQTLALTGRQVGGGEGTVLYADLVRDVQPFQVFAGVLRQRGLPLQRLIKQVVIGKDRSE